MKDPIVQALSEVVEALVQRGVVATPIDGGLLLRLAPVRGQATAADSELGVQVGKLRKSW